MHGLNGGFICYENNPIAARKFSESLVEKGNQKAIMLKIEGLEKGWYGYEKDPIAVKELSEYLIKKGNPAAIQRKISGLINNYFSYEKNPIAAREFIESLVLSEFPIARAIGKYIKAFALKYGVSQLGYEKDREKAFKFIEQYHVPY